MRDTAYGPRETHLASEATVSEPRPSKRQIGLKRWLTAAGVLSWVLLVHVVFYSRVWEGYGDEAVSWARRVLSVLGISE